MNNSKNQLVAAIVNNAYQRLGQLAGELVRTRPGDKEPILAEMEYRDWLADSCLISLDHG